MISDEQLESFADRILEIVGPMKIVLFGSYASGEATEDSDVDILLVCDSDKPKHRRIQEIRRALRPLPFPVDILVYTPEEIRRYENEEGTFVHHVLTTGRVMHAA
jgi:predicted nucleotidyltransferase